MILIEQGNQVAEENWYFDLDLTITFSEFKIRPIANAVITINPDDDYSDIEEYTHLIKVIIIPFTSFADGRVFSVARQLRQAFKYGNKIIVSGPMISAQYGFALQCGIDGILIPEELFLRQPISLWQQALAIHPVKHDVYRYPQLNNFSYAAENEASLDQLNQRLADKSAEYLLRFVTNESNFGRTAVVSSFGAESAILLHLIAQIDPSIPVIFIDTGKHFRETIEYKDTLTEYLGLTNVITIAPREKDLRHHDNNGLLHMTDTTACCYLRKVLPLEQALEQFDTWISGRKFYQTESRKHLPLFEQTGHHVKVNPLIHWGHSAMEKYMLEHNLPKHPLVREGYTSIGCSHCTTPTVKGEDSRAGRWRREDKTECGIHFIDGEIQRESKVTARSVEQTQQRSSEEDIIWTNWAF